LTLKILFRGRGGVKWELRNFLNRQILLYVKMFGIEEYQQSFTGSGAGIFTIELFGNFGFQTVSA
jgi:hypothetical protein